MIKIPLNVHRICEFLAHWLGGTTRGELATLLGYGDRQVTSLLRLGAEERGSKHCYVASRKRWVGASLAKDLHGPRSADQVIAVLRAINAWGHDAIQHPLAPIVDIACFNRPVSPDMFAMLMGACVRKQAVSVRYRAKARDLAVVFSPHTLVQAPHRMHFRGFSFFEDSGEGHYWDLVPSRLLDAIIVQNEPYIDMSGDQDWKTTNTLELSLRPDLPDKLRLALILEHGLESGNNFTIDDIPKALMRYIKSSYVDRRYSNFDHSVWDVI